MAFDRHTNSSSTNKPFLPRVANGSSKGPITPRLAAQHMRASPSPSVVSHTSSRSVAANRNPAVSVVGGSGEDVNTPIKSLLNSNITPRSSHRKSRLETGSNVSTPSGTPVAVLSPLPVNNAHDADNTVRRRPSSVVDGRVEENVSPSTQAPSNFFHANDVEPIEKTRRPVPKKAATFFYANGGQEERSEGLSQRSPSPTQSAVSAATGSTDIRPQLLRHQSAASSTHFPFRPPSPQKSGFHLTFRKGASQVLPTRSPIVSPPPPIHSQPLSSPSKHRKSANDQNPQPHIRNSSISSLDTTPSSRKASPPASDVSSRQAVYARASPPITSQPFTPIEKVVTFDITEETPQLQPSIAHSYSPRPGKDPASPMLASPRHKVPANFAEAAANARRERKVLDLEISNSSLLAINRQLEREVRRQKMELRRFRRLSRAGRLSSIGSVLPDADDVDDSDEENSDSNVAQSPSDEEEDEDEESPDVSLLSEENADQEYGLYHGGAARLEKDERRLKLDLNRHRQLLVDSQKMNQSLKRCMVWTEEMIAEGKKALAYKINVSDVRLGGRVLQAEDVGNSSVIRANDDDNASTETQDHDAEDQDEEIEPRQGLLGTWSPPASTTPLTTLVNATDGLFGLALQTSPEKQRKPPDDAVSNTPRDSGVDVNYVGSLS